jgi:hypothetical protein
MATQTRAHKSEEFRRFEELARKVLQTPKEEYDKHQAEKKKAKGRAKGSRSKP